MLYWLSGYIDCLYRIILLNVRFRTPLEIFENTGENVTNGKVKDK